MKAPLSPEAGTKLCTAIQDTIPDGYIFICMVSAVGAELLPSEKMHHWGIVSNVVEKDRIVSYLRENAQFLDDDRYNRL